MYKLGKIKLSIIKQKPVFVTLHSLTLLHHVLLSHVVAIATLSDIAQSRSHLILKSHALKPETQTKLEMLYECTRVKAS